MKYQWDGGSIVWETQEGIIFRADEIKKERTGNHAKMFFSILKEKNLQIIFWSYFNFDKASDRQAFINKSLQRIGDINRAKLQKNIVLEKFDNFCCGLFDFSTQKYEAQHIEGNPFPTGPTFLLKPFIIEGGGSVLFAPPGRGKSYTSQAMAISIDTGLQDLWETRKRKVLFINLERPHKFMSDRIGSINKALGLDPIRPLLVLNAKSKSLKELKQILVKSIEKYKVEMVFVDSISRTGVGSLVNDESANLIIDTLNQTCPTWFAIAHTPRGDSTHSYGSVMIEAGEDIGIQLISQFEESNNSLGIGLKITKANDIPIPSKPMIFSYLFDKDGLKAISKAKNGDYPEIESGSGMSNKDIIKEFLLTGKTSIIDISGNTGIPYGTVARILNTNKSVFVSMRDGKKVLWGVKDD